jgi:hypothetical protein
VSKRSKMRKLGGLILFLAVPATAASPALASESFWRFCVVGGYGNGRVYVTDLFQDPRPSATVEKQLRETAAGSGMAGLPVQCPMDRSLTDAKAARDSARTFNLDLGIAVRDLGMADKVVGQR